jgi:DOPA 4,5-dioxygenase
MEIVKEYHFHVYWSSDDLVSKADAFKLLKGLEEQHLGILGHINEAPIGPHILCSCEVWCPIEWFAKTYSYVTLNRPNNISVLLHPLTKSELTDHTDRAVWFGPQLPLKLTVLSEHLDNIPLQYPELKLGYSAQIGI